MSAPRKPGARFGGKRKAATVQPIDIPSGSLRVWWIPEISGPRFEVPVSDLTQAKLLLTTLANYDLFLHEQYDSRQSAAYASHGGLEVMLAGTWTEWHNADGNDIRWVMQSQEAA